MTRKALLKTRLRRPNLENLELRRLLAGKPVELEGDAFTAHENSPQIELDVLANDVFTEEYQGSKQITAVSVGNRGGRVSIAEDRQTVLYRAPADFAGTETFRYFLGDESASVRIKVLSALKNDRFSLPPDNATHLLDVLKNDRFWEGYSGKREITSVSSTSSDSQVEIANDRKSLLYTPEHSASGHHDQITYIVDGRYSAQIEVRLKTVVREDQFEFLEDAGEQVLGVLENDSFWMEYQGPREITHVIHDTDHGATVSISEDRKSVTYSMPTDGSSYDHFRYVVDNKFESSVSLNLPSPVQNDYFSVEANAKEFRLNVLGNDRYWSISNREIDIINRVTAVGTSANGGLLQLGKGGGSVLYTPPEDFVGEDEFTYTADDMFEAHVTLRVVPPVHNDYLRVYQGVSDQQLRVLRNDFPGNGYTGERQITEIVGGTSGAVISASNEVVLYSPPADFSGTDEFVYTVDGTFDATVVVEVIPLAKSDYYDLCPTTEEQHTLNVLGNDLFRRRGYDGAKQIDRVQVLEGDASVSIGLDGDRLIYQPGLQQYSRLRYTVDGKYETDVTVSQFNWLNSDQEIVDQNSGATNIDVLANDFHDDMYLPCRTSAYTGERRITSTSESQHGGTVSIVGEGKSIEYTPASDFFGSDSFSYTVDGGMQQTAYVQVVRYVQDDKAIVAPGHAEAIFVQANDLYSTDYLGPRLITNISSSTLGATVTVSDDGRHLLYTAPAAAVGQETLTYTIDGQLKAEVEVTVLGEDGDLFPQFTSLDEYQEFLIQDGLQQYQYLFGQPQFRYGGRGFGGYGGGWGGGDDGGAYGCEFCSVGGSVSRDFSATNVQVEGVDEADIVEFDEDYVYFLTGNDLVILDAWPAAELHEASRMEIVGSPVAQFLDGDRLTVISQFDDRQATSLLRDSFGQWDDLEIDSRTSTPGTIVTVLNVADRTRPELIQRTTMDGRYLQSRAVGEHVYIVLDNQSHAPGPIVVPGENPDPDSESPDNEFLGLYETASQYADRLRQNSGELFQAALPTFYAEGPEGNIVRSGLLHEPEELTKPQDETFGSLISLVAISTDNSEPGITSASGLYTHAGATVYASLEHFYVFQHNYDDNGSSTNIVQFDWNRADGGVTVSSTGYVPGTMLNQFSADEYEGHLRVVTTIRNPHTGQSEADLFVLKDDRGVLEYTGSLQSLAVGESAQSVRFMGPRAFIVTYRNVDPLFGLDVSDPTNPQDLGQLTITGFSTYMQLIDENHLLAVGRNTPNGFSGPAQVSLFNVEDLSNPYLVDEFTMERFARSEAGFDHHAFGYFAKHGLLAVPMSRSFTHRTDDDLDGYAEKRNWTTEHQLMVFQIDVNADAGSDTGVQHVAEITHDSRVRRSGYVGDYLYSIADDSIQVSSTKEPGTVIGVAADLRQDVLAEHERPESRILPSLVQIAQTDIHQRLSLSPGEVLPVAVETGPDGWQAVLRVDGAYFRYEGTRDDAILAGAGYNFDPAGTEVSWVNPNNAADVDGDGEVTPGDAVAILDFLNGRTAVELSSESVLRQVLLQDDASRGFWDVSGDKLVSPLDILLVIEDLNQAGGVHIDLGTLNTNEPGTINDLGALDELYTRIRGATGDANLDGQIDFEDFLVLSAHFADAGDRSYREADFNGDGDVDFNDFVILANNVRNGA